MWPQMENLDPDLKTLFDQVGVSEEQLKDKETADFIYDFIEQQGGLNKIKQDIQTQRVPPPPPPAIGRQHHADIGPPAGTAETLKLPRAVIVLIRISLL